MQLAYRFALSPTPRQARQFSSHAGGARFAFNWGLDQVAQALDARAAEKERGVEKPTTPIPGHFDLCKTWTAHKDATPELAWVGDNFSGTYQAALRDSATAWKNFLDSKTGRRKGRRVGRPRFKSRRKTPPSFQMHGAALRVESQTTVRRQWKSLGGKARTDTLNGLALNLPKVGRVTVMSDHDRRWVAGHRDNADAERNRRRARQLHQLVAAGQARLIRANISMEPDGIWYASVTAEILHPDAAQLDVDADLTWDVSSALDDHSADEVRAAVAWLRGQQEKLIGKTLRARLRQARKDDPALKEAFTPATVRPTRRQRDNGTVGVDLGVKYLAVLSDGQQWDNPRRYAAALDKLRVAQQALSRTQDDSRRRARARHRVALLHARVRRARDGANGRAASKLLREYAHVVVEGWDIQQAMAKGAKDAPKAVRKARNRALSDSARGDFRNALVLGGPRRGCTVTVLDPHVPTGRTCSRCGSVRDKPVPPADDKFNCPACGYVGDRRLNTARVLAGVATSQITPQGVESRGGDVRPEAPRGGGQSPVKRAARTRPKGRGETGTSDP